MYCQQNHQTELNDELSRKDWSYSLTVVSGMGILTATEQNDRIVTEHSGRKRLIRTRGETDVMPGS